MSFSLKTVEESVKRERLSICQSCEEFQSAYRTCRQCGCYMPAKATFAITACPIGKWQESQPGNSIINKLEEAILESWNKQ